MRAIEVSVIISTYNQPEWLQKVLWSYQCQSFQNFEMIIADDGSKEETKKCIDDFAKTVDFPVKHVWQEDDGFQKTKILNKAILMTTSDYLIFTDGDCIARQDFVEKHFINKKMNTVLSGGYFKLIKDVSNLIIKRDIVSQDCFDSQWLISKGQPKSFKINKLTKSDFKVWFLNTFTTTKATFDGMNVSAWKKDILEVNGFDERMEYGGEDREIGERLVNKGIKFKQFRYSAICLHLYHERPYKNEAAELINNQIRKQTKNTKAVYTKFGFNKNHE